MKMEKIPWDMGGRWVVVRFGWGCEREGVFCRGVTTALADSVMQGLADPGGQSRHNKKYKII